MNHSLIRVAILDVSCLDRDELFRSKLACVSEWRREKTLRYHFRKDQNLSLGVAIVLDHLLAAYGLHERDMKYSEGSYGKPVFAERPELYFNLSHSGTYAMGAIAERELGIDIEQTIFADEALMERCCHPTEIEYLHSLAQSQRDIAFTRIWTLKESFIKVLGIGLNYDSLTELYSHPTEPTLQGHRMNKTYSFSQTDLPQYSFAICVEGEFKTNNIELKTINLD